MEQKVRAILGDLAFQVAALQHQLDEAKARIKELETNVEDNA